MTEYSLVSSPMINTPGVIRWICKAIVPFDRPKALSLLKAGWPKLTPRAHINLLNGKYTVDDDNETVWVEG